KFVIGCRALKALTDPARLDDDIGCTGLKTLTAVLRLHIDSTAQRGRALHLKRVSLALLIGLDLVDGAWIELQIALNTERTDGIAGRQRACSTYDAGRAGGTYAAGAAEQAAAGHFYRPDHLAVDLEMALI